jgi:hypothetical protein
MSTDKFLTVATNILHKAFIEGSRTTAKAVFTTIFDGKRASLVTLKMDDDSESRFDITLDHSEFSGKLNFGLFKSVLSHMLVQIAEYVKSGKEIPVFTDENTGNVLFGLPGVFEKEGDVNALLLGADLKSPGLVNLQLQFVDPEQFLQRDVPENA